MMRPVALITGAAQGIGRATALAFAAAGYDLVVTDLAVPREAALEIEAAGVRATALAADVAQESDWRRVISAIAHDHGRLDALVNNAGISGPVAPLHEVTTEAFDQVLAVNVRGVFLGIKHARDLLIAAKGAVVNVGSIAGLTGGANTIAPHGVRVNAVCPAPTDTAMMQALAAQFSPEDPARFHRNFAKFIPLQRYAEATEIAAAIVFLASPAAAFITGVAMPVDGGVRAR
jgi:NAD(P)-dependent dehydrogenase (short-subunit alcohol dehydrogenase family)